MARINQANLLEMEVHLLSEWQIKMHEWNKPERDMDHMNQEPLDFAAALTLLREARAEITRLRMLPEEGVVSWISVSDRLPRLSDRVILFDEWLGRCIGHYLADIPSWHREGNYEYPDDLLSHVTHWMPLADAPYVPEWWREARSSPPQRER